LRGWISAEAHQALDGILWPPGFKVAEPLRLSRKVTGSGGVVPGSHQYARVFAGVYGDGDLFHEAILVANKKPI
jgi:hypothetical protein